MNMMTDAAQVARHEAARAAAHAGGEFLTFRLGEEEYGIDILRVQEIRSYEQPTRIANAPAFIKGVVNLRGVIVPIVDLRLKLGCDTAEYNSFTVVIVLNVKGRVVGAVVDSVSDVLELARRLDQAGTGNELGGRRRLHHRHRLDQRAHADPDGHRIAHGISRHGPDQRRPVKA